MREAASDHEIDVDVLVVDDVAQNLVAAEALLRRPGVRVLTARSGEQALELLLSHDVAVALVDVQMPSMDGFTLAELMRGSLRTRNVPIMFLTAAREEHQRVFRGYEAGAVDFLHKPFDPHVLLSKVGVFVELARHRRQLQQALNFNEMMTAVLAHDLRTPLSAILTSAEVVLTVGDDGLRRAGGHIKASGSRMARMIDQLLDFSKLRSGSISLQRRPTRLHALAEAVLAEIRQARPNIDVRLHSSASDDTAHVDPDRIAQVLVNLIDNAARHGEQGQPIELQMRELCPDRLMLSIRNSGELPSRVREHLFAPFRAGSPNGAGEGLGLGLYIVDQFVRANGGRVHGRSTDNVTVFDIELPRAP